MEIITPLKRNRFEVYYTLDNTHISGKEAEDLLRLNTHRAHVNGNEVVLFLYLGEDAKVSDTIDEFFKPFMDLPIRLVSYKGDHSIAEELTYTLTDINIDKDYNFDWSICNEGVGRNIIVTGRARKFI